MTLNPAILLDNPILTKHWRSKLRRPRVVTWTIVVLTLCFLICWGFYLRNGLLGTGPVSFVVMLQVVILVFGGSTEIGSAIGGARESGILDFHRVSPTPPLWLAIGFFLGAPVLEYWLTLLTLPFAIGLAMVGPVGVVGLLAFEVPLLLAAWLFHALAMLGAMTSKKPKGGNRGFIGLIFLMIFFGQGLFFGVRGLLGVFAVGNATLSFFGVPMHWMLFLAFYEAVLIVFFFIPSVRRMRSERAHLYTKRQALAFLGALGVLTLGAAWEYKGVEFLVVGILYGLALASCVLVGTMTPDRGEYVKGLRRALRMGRRRPSPWSDAGINRIPLFAACGIVLVTTTIAWEAIEGRALMAERATYSLTIAIGVLTVAYVGLGLQAARLFMPKHGSNLFALGIFFLWFVPLILGGILAASNFSDEATTTLLALSPIAGIAISTESLPIEADMTPARIAAILPAASFAFLFHFLLDVVQRRVDLAVRSSEETTVPDPFADLLGGKTASEAPEQAPAG